MKSGEQRMINEIIKKAEPVLKATSDALCINDINGNKLYSNGAYDTMIKRGNAEIISDAKNVYVDNKKIASVVVYHDISEVNRFKRELDRLSQKLRKVETKITFEDIIGDCQAMRTLISAAKTAAATPATIMLRGESGTGKEVFANAIHNASPRRNEKIVKINCSSIPDELFESELFGYKEGAFTGAQRGGKKGLFQEANNGTLFLDEIGDVSLRMQGKLLRALQEKEIMPVGSTKSIHVNVRIICATNKPLEKMIEDGRFREDLYYRLNVFPLFIPTLSERKDDIDSIIAYILNKYNGIYERSVVEIDDSALKVLMAYEWPGNVRELENVIARAMINKGCDEEKLTEADVLSAMSEKVNRMSKKELFDEMEFPIEINKAIEKTETLCIKRALKQANDDKNKAAVILGIPIRTLYYKCKKLGL